MNVEHIYISKWSDVASCVWINLQIKLTDFDDLMFQSLCLFTYPVALPEVCHYRRTQTPRWIQTSSWQRNLEQINEKKCKLSYVLHWTSVHCWVHLVARKHSSRMRTARLQTISALLATRCQHKGVKQGPQVNRFEQVSGVNHQMSLPGWSCPELGGVRFPV